MTDNNKNRTRPALEDLEGRQLADAKPFGALVGPVGIVVARPVPVEVAHMSLAGPSATSTVRAPAASSFQYTAVTIKNSTTVTLNYSFRWGNGTFTNYKLTPGQQRVHYIGGLNQTATIAYDKSFSPGVQEQRYSLPGRNIVRLPGFYLVEPTPSISEGRLYTFKGVFNGVQLYS